MSWVLPRICLVGAAVEFSWAAGEAVLIPFLVSLPWGKYAHRAYAHNLPLLSRNQKTFSGFFFRFSPLLPICRGLEWLFPLDMHDIQVMRGYMPHAILF
jgi:hypothetical protein